MELDAGLDAQSLPSAVERTAAQNDSERQMTIVLYHGQMTVVALADAVGETAAALQPCDGSDTVADCEKRPDR